MTTEEIKKAREKHMETRGILKFERNEHYKRPHLRRFIKHIRKNEFYESHTSDGQVTLKFKSKAQKERLMGELMVATRRWQKTSS